MKKKTLIPAIVFIILAGGLFLLFTNLELDFFSGTEKIHDEFTLEDREDSKDVSLVSVRDGKAKLDTKGWAMAIGLIVILPFLLAAGSRRRLKRKERKKLEQHQTLKNETTF